MPKLTDQEETTKSSYNAQPQEWAKYFDDAGGWPKQLAQFRKLLPKGRVLEIGTGTGRDAKDLIGAGYEYVGTDVSEGLLNVARQRLPKNKFIVQSVYDLSFDEKFDGFWASAVLLHIPKSRIDEALQKIKSVSKEDAVGFISVKEGAKEAIMQHDINGKVLNRFFSYWAKEEFEDVLRKNGFEVLHYDYKPVSDKTNWHLFIVKNIKN